MPVSVPSWNTQNYWDTSAQSQDPYAAQRAAAAGMGAAAAASSGGAYATGVNNQKASANAMATASNAASKVYPDWITSVEDRAKWDTLSERDRSDWARAHGSAVASGLSAYGANQAGLANEKASANAMATMSNLASSMAGAPPPPPVVPVIPGYNPMATNIPYATWENIQPYFNPMYQFLLDSGSNQIKNAAASAGMLGSSGTFQDVGDWAVRAGAQAYDAAVQNFMGDRTGVYGIGKDLRDFDWQNYVYQNQLGLGLYNAEKEDYQSQLKDFYGMMLGLSNTGENAAKTASGLTTDSATAMANLFMALAQMQSMGGIAQANNQSSFMSDLFSLIPGVGKLFGG